MFFGPNRSMPPMQQPMRPSQFRMGPGPSPFMQQPQNNMFNMFNMPNSPMSNMPNQMLRNPSPFMGGAGRGMGLGGNSGGGGGGGLLAKLFGRTGARSIGNMGGLGQLANTGRRWRARSTRERWNSSTTHQSEQPDRHAWKCSKSVKKWQRVSCRWFSNMDLL